MGKNGKKQLPAGVVKTAQVVMKENGNIMIMSVHRWGRQMGPAEIADLFATAAKATIGDLVAKEKETPVDKARKNIVVPPPGALRRIRERGN
jgi:hypothetical protein